MNSQNDEEMHILKYFGSTKGRFYYIGAWDGMRLSNTYALLRRGWSGIMVEPEFNAFAALMKNTRQFGTRVELVNAAITPDVGMARFWSSRGDAVSTMNDASLRNWEKAVGGMDGDWIHPMTPEALFSHFGEASFISLDVEGENWPVFQAIPFASWPGLRMVCVEHDKRDKEMAAHASAYGFSVIAKNPENLILAKMRQD